jgi:hypothetical protein
MRLFKTRTDHRYTAWKRDGAGQAYASHGRFRLTIKRGNERWFYSVSDMDGAVPPVDSTTFLTEQETLDAAQAELEQGVRELPLHPRY